MSKKTSRTQMCLVLFAGICGLIVCGGIARFSYTPMIPYMQNQVTLAEGLAGWLAGWNYLGYFVGVGIAIRIHQIKSKDSCYRLGILIAIISTAMMAINTSPLVWSVSRLFAGISSAAGFMLCTGLVLHWLRENNHRAELGIYFSGAGLGIVISSLAVEISAQSLTWSQQWYLLSLVALLFSIPALTYLPRPQHTGYDRQQHKSDLADTRLWRWLLQVAYACAGFGFVINATFTVVITDLQPSLQGQGRWVWMVVGVFAIPAPILWDRFARQFGAIKALQLAFVMHIIGIVLPVFSGSLSAAILSAVLFGFTFIGVVSLTMAMVGNKYASQASQVMSIVTVGYCLGQIIGPVLAGELAERTGNFNSSLLGVAGLMFIGLTCLIAMDRVGQN